MENVVWQENINEFKEIEYHYFIKLPTWCKHTEIKIIIDNGIFSNNVFRSRVCVNGGSIRVVYENENIKNLEEIKKETINRLKQLFNL